MTDNLAPITVSMAVAAQLLGVSRPTAYEFAKMPGFPAFKVGGRVLVSVEGLKRWVEEQTEAHTDAS